MAGTEDMSTWDIISENERHELREIAHGAGIDRLDLDATLREMLADACQVGWDIARRRFINATNDLQTKGT